MYHGISRLTFIGAMLLAARVAPAQAQSRSVSPIVRVTLSLDSATTAQFDARDFDLNASQRVAAQDASTAGAEIRLVKRAGAYTATLVSLSVSGARLPAAVIEVLDSIGGPAVTFRLSDVTVVSNHLSLSSARASLEQQRLSQQEALSALTADFREAQRQLATIEELNKTRSTTRADLDRARDRANDLDRRIDLLRQRQALLGRQIEEQGPLDETILLRFGRLSIETPEPGGVAAIEIAPRAPRR